MKGKEAQGDAVKPIFAECCKWGEGEQVRIKETTKLKQQQRGRKVQLIQA